MEWIESRSRSKIVNEKIVLEKWVNLLNIRKETHRILI